ncbi:WD40-repeat-containing domain protein [Pilobolus umbonatus]|nr:WD40-repeat-containing domain protein [Pilobolus umbonatus]
MPSEIISLILSYCDTRTVLICSGVCQLWYRLCCDYQLWKTLYTHHYRFTSCNDYHDLYRRQHLLAHRWKTQKQVRCDKVTHTDSVYCAQLSMDSFMTGSKDMTIKIWDLSHPPNCIRTLRGHTKSVLCLQYDNNVLVSGSSDTTLIVWSIPTYHIITRLISHTASVLDVCLNKKVIVSASKDHTIRVWDKSTYTPLLILSHQGSVNAIQLHGNRLASASTDTLVKLWNVDTGACLMEFRGHTLPVACVRYNGHHIVSGGSDKQIMIWNPETGRCIRTCTGHTGLVRSLELDDHKIVSGSYDKSIRIWDFHTGQCMRIFPRCHSSYVYDIVFNETKMISTSQNGKVLIMDFGYGMNTANLYT